MKNHNCEKCKFRQKYDQSPKSFLGKIWRWHINFCPGWKAYVNSLDEITKTEISDKYKFVIK